jgi:hypothetical protein
MPKICEIGEVREYMDGLPVELWRQPPLAKWPHGDGSQRLVIRAYNEGGNAYTDIDLADLIVWLQNGAGNHRGALNVELGRIIPEPHDLS